MSTVENAPDALAAEHLAGRGIAMDYGAVRVRHGAPVPAPYHAEALDPRCLSPEEFDLLLEGAPWRRVLSVGDSTIEGLGDPVDGYETHPFVERLVAALRRRQPNLRFMNLGTRDLTAPEVAATQLEAALAFQPTLAILIAGGNDMFPPEWDPDGAEQALDQLVGTLRATGCEVITCTYMNAVNAIPMFKGTPLDERLPELNERIRAVARRHGAILVDHTDSSASFDVEVYSHDLKHVTMRGHAIVAADFAKAIFEHLQPEAAAALRGLVEAPAPAAPAGTPYPSTPLVYGGAMDPSRLQSMSIFAELPAVTLEQISLYIGERGVPEGEPLIVQGDYSHELICIEQGTADVVRDGEVIAQLGPGEVVGEIGILRRTTRTATVVATSPMRLITLTSWDINRLPARVVDRLEALVEERLRLNTERAASSQHANGG